MINCQIIRTSPEAVTFLVEGTVTTVAWADLRDAARQTDAALAASYRQLLDQALDVEIIRVYALPVRLCSEIEEEAPYQYVARVWWQAGPYAVASGVRAADEGGSLWTYALAERERDERVARSAAGGWEGRHSRSIASSGDIRKAVLRHHQLSSPVPTDLSVHL